jgi:uncharacterized protein with PQ loop repeat
MTDAVVVADLTRHGSRVVRQRKIRAQVIKAWRNGDTEASSRRIYVVSPASYTLWDAPGLMIASTPVILITALNVIFAGAALAL